MIATLGVVLAAAAALRGAWSPCGLSVLSSLNPVSERTRGHSFWVTSAWYVWGAVAGGALLGGGCALGAALLGLLDLPIAAVWGAVLTAAVVAVASDSRTVPFQLPDHPRQVDERWLVTYRRWIYAGGYGLQIGTGFATYVMSAAVYLTAALAVLSGSAWTAFWVGVEFGAVRGLTVLVVSRATTPERLRALLARVDSLDAASLTVAALTSGGAGAVAAGMLAGPVAGVVVGAALCVLVLAPGLRTRVVTPAGPSSAPR